MSDKEIERIRRTAPSFIEDAERIFRLRFLATLDAARAERNEYRETAKAIDDALVEAVRGREAAESALAEARALLERAVGTAGKSRYSWVHDAQALLASTAAKPEGPEKGEE
jgi:hypothetical protein